MDMIISAEEIIREAKIQEEARKNQPEGPMMAISYETPKGTFKDWLEAAAALEACDLDPVDNITIIRTPIQ